MKTLLLIGFSLMMSYSISAQTDSCFFHAPNVVASNCDGPDHFRFEVKSSCAVSSAKLTLFNRWGELISELEGKSPVWNAEKAPAGNYIYLFEGLYAGGVGFKTQGAMNVIR